ncbi:unnamed protein product [Tetraodon nigroviridis]|uniref:(spotted green pufferfish) hypothetical protein n=1 Tax=Tetraodon nigroviridis TaxID=99883 RepID=Q4SPV6_TETNG|nr:unnamed protein product [Tetraodon nigroviridis]
MGADGLALTQFESKIKDLPWPEPQPTASCRPTSPSTTSTRPRRTALTQYHLESVKLARLVFNRLFELCCLWMKELPFRRRPQPYYETSIHAIKNMRRKMEDKHVIIPDFNTLFNVQDQEEQAYFAVFDGHGGVDAAIYAANHLHVNLVRQESFSHDPSEALCRAFKLTDEGFVKKARREQLRCGTTGVVTFLRGRTLYVAWLGDSQVILVRRGQVVELMKPHKPDREPDLCPQRLGAQTLHLRRRDHNVFPLDGWEDYLILACDGFWDTVSPDEAVRVVSDHLQENSGDTTMVAHKLVASARDAGSSDNITVIVVFLRDRARRRPTRTTRPRRRGRRRRRSGAGRGGGGGATTTGGGRGGGGGRRGGQGGARRRGRQHSGHRREKPRRLAPAAVLGARRPGLRRPDGLLHGQNQPQSGAFAGGPPLPQPGAPGGHLPPLARSSSPRLVSQETAAPGAAPASPSSIPAPRTHSGP